MAISSSIPAQDGTTEATRILIIDKSKDGGAEKAYQNFHDDVYEYAQRHSADETKQFVDKANESFVKNGILPDIALGWAKDDGLARFAKKGKLTDEQIKSAEQTGLTPDASSPASLTNDLLAGTLATGLEDRSTYTKVTGSKTYDQDGIDKYLDKQGKDNDQAAKQLEARKAVAPLFQGTPPLLEVLDQQSNGKIDGVISREDLTNYIQVYKSVTSNGKYPQAAGTAFSEENKKFVQDILDGKNPVLSHFVPETPNLWTDPSHPIRLDDIKRATGVPLGKSATDDDGFIANFKTIWHEDESRQSATYYAFGGT